MTSAEILNRMTSYISQSPQITVCQMCPLDQLEQKTGQYLCLFLSFSLSLTLSCFVVVRRNFLKMRTSGEFVEICGDLGFTFFMLILFSCDRECEKDKHGSVGCQSMCCGRGFTSQVIEIKQRCDCKYYWCCYVKCKTCIKKVEINRCRWHWSNVNVRISGQFSACANQDFHDCSSSMQELKFNGVSRMTRWAQGTQPRRNLTRMSLMDRHAHTNQWTFLQRALIFCWIFPFCLCILVFFLLFGYCCPKLTTRRSSHKISYLADERRCEVKKIRRRNLLLTTKRGPGKGKYFCLLKTYKLVFICCTVYSCWFFNQITCKFHGTVSGTMPWEMQ